MYKHNFERVLEYRQERAEKTTSSYLKVKSLKFGMSNTVINTSVNNESVTNIINLNNKNSNTTVIPTIIRNNKNKDKIHCNLNHSIFSFRRKSKSEKENKNQVMISNENNQKYENTIMPISFNINMKNTKIMKKENNIFREYTKILCCCLKFKVNLDKVVKRLKIDEEIEKYSSIDEIVLRLILYYKSIQDINDYLGNEFNNNRYPFSIPNKSNY